MRRLWLPLLAALALALAGRRRRPRSESSII